MTLKRFLQPREPTPFRSRALSGERCEFCGEPIPDEHSHVVNVEARGLLCSCRACYLLFTHGGAAGGKYRAVPQRYLRAPLALTDAQWDRFQIPVAIAFFFQNTPMGRTTAFYPSPAGATESLLSLEAWDELVGENPFLAELVPDVEALLIYKGAEQFQCFIVPIDACYELVGRVRRKWKGFVGGDEAWSDINAFFDSVQARCREPAAGRTG